MPAPRMNMRMVKDVYDLNSTATYRLNFPRPLSLPKVGQNSFAPVANRA